MELARVLYSVDQRRQAQGYGIMTPDDMISGRVRNWITQEDMNARYGVSILLTVVFPLDRFQTKISLDSTNFHQFVNSTILPLLQLENTGIPASFRGFYMTH